MARKQSNSRSQSKKQAPSKKSKQTSAMQWVLVAFFALLILIAVVLIALSIFKSSPLLQKSAAMVNGESISESELMVSYGLMVPKQFQTLISPYQFLNDSIIPQQLLLQAAHAHGIAISDEEIDATIESLLIANALTQKELETELRAQGLSLKDFRETYRVRLAISQYLNETIFQKVSITEREVRDAYAEGPYAQFNYTLLEAAPFIRSQLLEEKRDSALNAHIEDLRSNAKIEILLKDTGKMTSFQKTEDSCSINGLPLIRAYTVSTCEECAIAIAALKDVIDSYAQEESPFIAHLWELDTGDDLMTLDVESKVPSSELAYFKSISPKNLVPAYSFGCSYVRIGHQGAPPLDIIAESTEFSSLLEELAQHGE